MCAIFGIVGEYDESMAQKAFSTLSHRGLDESRTLIDPSCFIGVHRLAITALNTTHIQPIEKNGIRFFQ